MYLAENYVLGEVGRSNISDYHTHVLSFCIATVRSMLRCSHLQIFVFAFNLPSYLRLLLNAVF